MSWPTAIVFSMFSVLLMSVISFDAQAVELRRPYNENIVFNYGFDNNYGSGSCRDFNCGSHCYSGHRGTDHAMVVGTNVLAGADGRVIATNNTCADYGSLNNTCGGRCGNYVRIQHSDGQVTLYCHMKRNSLTVSTNQNVTCGQKIGQSASSGSSTGPHLHLGWITNGVSRDVFRGSCTTSPGAWRQQNGYRQAVGTSCGCVPTTEVCDGQDNNCSGQVDDGDVCEIDFLRRAPGSYITTRTSDVTGNGLQDACGRFADGWGCFPATGDGWGEKIATTLMSDASGWGSASHYATIRMGDLDGDGLADVCARHSTRGFQCWRSTGTGFEHYGDAPGYTNADNWNRPEYYTTFRLVDINGNGRDDVCARGPDGWRCRLSTGTGFGAEVRGPDWSDASGFARAQYYGTIRTGDLNGDGKQDVCIRRIAGFDCFLSTGDGFERFDLIDHFSNAAGWSDMKYWNSIRLVDFDGDGRDDVCARFANGIRCFRSTDAGFEESVLVAGLSDANGWGDPTNHQTLRTGDVNGDGAQNLCARANAGMRCYGRTDGEGFSITGPEWSNAGGWDKPEHFHTITVTDIDPDRRRDLCARASAGLICHRSTDEGFERLPTLGAFSNAADWNQQKYYSTLRLGTGVCGTELCSDFDEDCDGVINNGQPTQMGRTPPALAARFIEAYLPESAVAGAVVEATVRFKNEGTSAWPAERVFLEAIANDEALIEALRPAQGWLGESSVAALGSEVAPGQDGVWSFALRVPDDEDVFDRVLFTLVTDEGPISCPAPSVTLRLGVTTEVPGDGGNNSHGNNNSHGGGGPDAGDMSDVDGPGSGGPSGTYTTSVSSCTTVGSGPGHLWPSLAALIGLIWMRRRRREPSSISLPASILMVIGLLLGGCDSSAPAPATQQAPVEASSALTPHDFADPSARINSPTTRLLGVYGDWQLHGTLAPALPNSDETARFALELRERGEVVDLSLSDKDISNAVFVPPGPSGKTPSLALRTSSGRLLHVDLSTGAVTQLDEEIGLLISVAANGCCLSYMRGEMGWQDELRVVTLDGGSVRSIALDQNSWSPAISPDGTQVIYVSATPTGDAQLVLRDVTANSSRVLVEQAEHFSTGPQPPFWTERGLAFAGEHGAYLLDPQGRLLGRDTNAHGLLVDFSDGTFVDADGKTIAIDE